MDSVKSQQFSNSILHRTAILISVGDQRGRQRLVMDYAVLNALRPLGITHIDMPLTSEKVWRAIQEARIGS